MKAVIHEHPVTTRLFGIGLPGWIGLAAAGWPIALLVATIVSVAFLMWNR